MKLADKSVNFIIQLKFNKKLRITHAYGITRV